MPTIPLPPARQQPQHAAGQQNTQQPARVPRNASRPIPSGGLEPVVMPFQILFDHRERAAGWRFAGLIGQSEDKYRPIIVKTKEVHLLTADYVLAREDGSIIPTYIERKSAEDFIGTITHGRENFEKEHQRMAEIVAAGGSCSVIIEGSYDHIMAELEGGQSMRRVSPATVRGTVAAQINDFGIPWFFAGNRRLAEEAAFWIFRKAWERNVEAEKKGRKGKK